MTRRLVRWMAAAACGALMVTRLDAQQPLARPGAPAAGTGFVRGQIFDSLLNAPLDSARVFINGTTISAMTDAGGRFRLDSVPSGRQIIVFSHPDLDSAGLTSIVRRIDVEAGRATIVELGVPSLFTMRRAACPRGIPLGTRDTGLVYGAVSDVTTGTRLAGARVHVSWIAAGRGPDGRVAVSRPAIDATTDSLGNYYVCGVPTALVITASAQAGRFASGVTELLLGHRGVARRDLALSRDAASLPDSTGLHRGTATLMGQVRDEFDHPRPSARIGVDDAAGDEVYADSAGRFVLRNLPSGSQMVMVRQIGFGAVRVPVLLRDHDTSYVSVHLHELTVLDTMRITAGSLQSQQAMEDLQYRMRNGLGYFLLGEEIKNRPSMRSVVQALPSSYIEGPNVYQWEMHTLVAGKPCPVTIYVDGIQEQSTESIQSYRPDQLIAVEWYPRGSAAPMRYQPAGNADCAVLIIWTKFMR